MFFIPLGMSLAPAELGLDVIYGYGSGDPLAESTDTIYTFYSSSFANWTVSSLVPMNPGPSPRMNPVIAAWNKKLIVFGGYESRTNKLVKDSKSVFVLPPVSS